MTFAEIAQFSEDEARRHLENLRWPNGITCPHCESKDATRMEGKAHRKGAIQCNDCRQQFTVTVGTVMESTRVPLRKWIMAFHLLCSSKKGYSALQLKRDLGLGSYKTAWFMAHRIRYAMNNGPLSEKLKGTVEMDETYVGGRPRYRSPKNKRGRGTKKTPVVALVERRRRGPIQGGGQREGQDVECGDSTACGQAIYAHDGRATALHPRWSVRRRSQSYPTQRARVRETRGVTLSEHKHSRELFRADKTWTLRCLPQYEPQTHWALR